MASSVVGLAKHFDLATLKFKRSLPEEARVLDKRNTLWRNFLRVSTREAKRDEACNWIYMLTACAHSL